MIDKLYERLRELNPRDTFELGMYRFLAWAERTPRDLGDTQRLNDWADILSELAVKLRTAAQRAER